MRYHVVHSTRYVGSEPISVGHNEARLTPRITSLQRVLQHRIEIHPEPSIHSQRLDYFGNVVSQFSFNQGYHTLTVTSVNEVELLPLERSPAWQSEPWEEVEAAVAQHRWPEELAAYEFTFDSPRCRRRREFAEYARESFQPGRPIVEAIADLMDRVHRDHDYDATATNVFTPVEQFFHQRRGVCQDFAQLMISMIRSLGLPARYVSGYLRTLPPPGKPRLVGADASHAWLSAWCGRMGWIDFDPTNNLLPANEHVTVAWGRDYGDVPPLKGVYIGGGGLHLTVSVDVTEVGHVDPDPPRLMLPS